MVKHRAMTSQSENAYKFADKGVQKLFAAYPQPIRSRLLELRRLIFDVARTTPGVGVVEEALRWGQPSYITSETRSGSTIRLDQIRNEPNSYGVFFICTSGLVDIFKERYGKEMRFVGNRSIVFGPGDRLPEDALRHCISLALTHHLRKRAKT